MTEKDKAMCSVKLNAMENTAYNDNLKEQKERIGTLNIA